MSYTEEIFWLWIDLCDRHNGACSKAWEQLKWTSHSYSDDSFFYQDLISLARKYIQEEAA